MKHVRTLAIAAVAALVGNLTAGPAGAQEYPAKPVRMVVAWPPGSGADIMARILSDPLSRALGQQVVVDNRGGSNGIIGADMEKLGKLVRAASRQLQQAQLRQA